MGVVLSHWRYTREDNQPSLLSNYLLMGGFCKFTMGTILLIKVSRSDHMANFIYISATPQARDKITPGLIPAATSTQRITRHGYMGSPGGCHERLWLDDN